LTENAVRQLAMRSLALGSQYSIALAFRSGKRLCAPKFGQTPQRR
jgi:hypothetical protein